MTLIELLYDLPGRVFRSEMPFSSYDPYGKLFSDYQRERISTVVLLAEDSECQRITGFDLRKFYLEQGIKVIYLPIPDFGTPHIGNITKAVELACEQAGQGYHQVVHCHAGIGRTGMFAACLAIRIMGFSASDAISWVRERIPGAVEVPEQVQLIKLFAEGELSC